MLFAIESVVFFSGYAAVLLLKLAIGLAIVVIGWAVAQLLP